MTKKVDAPYSLRKTERLNYLKVLKSMSQYSISQEFSQVEDDIGSADDLSSELVNSTEDFREADQQSAAISQRTEFFVLSPY